MRLKRGSSVITLAIVLIISVVFITIIGTFIVSSITPYIWYEKLNYLALKYMFVIEKYGYLTEKEKQNLLSDSNSSGFDINKIKIEVPQNIKQYGELIEFKITYDIVQNIPSFKNGKYVLSKKTTRIVIRKNSYSKV